MTFQQAKTVINRNQYFSLAEKRSLKESLTELNEDIATNTAAIAAIDAIPSFKSYSFVSRAGASGEYYSAGYYDYATSDANLSNSSLTQVFGGTNVPHAAHAFVVAGDAGTTNGSDLVLTVTGTSITDAGVRTAADSEVIVADATLAATDDYFETSKKWIGAVTFTLSSTGGTTFTFDVNYGLCKYEDFGNRNFTLTDFESVGLANANDGGFNIELLHHSIADWTYAATGFQAGGTVLGNMNTTHSTEQDLDAGDYFAFKLANLATAIDGSNSEGLVIRVTTSVNASVGYMDSHIGVTF